MITLNLRPIFKARGITDPHKALRDFGFTRESTRLILDNNKISIRYKDIDRLCQLLLCEPNDLFLFTPEKDKLYAENLPLFKLVKKEDIEPMMDRVAKMSYAEIRAMNENGNKE